MNIKTRNTLLVLAIFFALILFGSYSGLASYTSAYEGMKASFVGVRYNNLMYTATQTNGASSARFLGTLLDLDPDEFNINMPNIEGEMTTVFIPEKASSMPMPQWVPREWTNELSLIQNPRRTFVYDVIVGGERKIYSMEEWVLKWYVSLEAGFYNIAPYSNAEGDSKCYTNTEVWFEFDTQPTWYFKGQETAYFSVAKVYLDGIQFAGRDINKIDVTPETVGTAMYICDTLGLSTTTTDLTPTFEGYYYNDVLLNPSLFKPKSYSVIVLNNFGTQSWWEGISLLANSDVVGFEFTVNMFIVGEWKTTDLQTDPEEYIRRIQIDDWTIYIPFLSDIVAWLGGVLMNPFTWLGIAVWLFLILMGVTVIAFYWKFGKPKRE